MATIPSLPLFTSGVAKSGPLNRLRDAIAFWQNPPAAMVVKSVAQNVLTGTVTLVTFETTSYDTDTIVTSSSRLTAKTSGRYAIGGKLTFAANATGFRRIQIRKNAAGSPTGGTLLIVETTSAITTAGVATPVSLGAGPEFQLAANDYIEAFAHHDSGATLALNVDACILTMRLAQVAATTSGQEANNLPSAVVQTLLSTEDLNAVTTPGNYLQDANADATLARNYPATQAGHLEVHGGASASFIMQRYTIYRSLSTQSAVYWRCYYAGVWDPWRQVATV